jgi:peroxiredoxin
MRYQLLIPLIIVSNFVFGQSSVSTDPDPLDAIFIKEYPKVFEEIGHPYPNFELKSGNGIINNKELQGKVVFINFWFKACEPCMAEMEGLNQLYNKLQNNKDFVFISIAKDNKEAINSVKKKFNLAFDAYSVSESECKRLNFSGHYPTTIIIDKTGIIRKIHIGGITDKDAATDRVMGTLLPEIQSLLGK